MSIKPLSKILTPVLVPQDSQSIKQDIITRILSDEDWNANWNGDLHQDAYVMFLETFSYLFERNARSANLQIKEKWVNQAFSPQSIYNDLADMQITLQQQTASVVNVTGYIQNQILTEPIVIPRFTQIKGINASNVEVTFEFILKDSITNKYKYFDNLIFYPNVTFTDHIETDIYAGVTYSFQYEITPPMKENFVINLATTNIIEDSIQVYYTGGATPIELPQTDTFIVEPEIMPYYFPNGKPHYIVSYNQDGSARILFSNAEFGGAFEDQHVGNNILVFCRSGGGLASNILTGGIYQTITLTISGGRTLNVLFTNLYGASGGIDKEDIYTAQIFAPYRYGRGKPILDEQDAHNKLYSLAIRHSIDSPKYDEVDRTVPILHSYHRVVYRRDFSNFSVPTVLTSDTLATYNERFIASLNGFCNVDGIRPDLVVDESVTTFVYPDTNDHTMYDYSPAYKYPLSGSLNAVAYDYKGNLVDSITWKTNYVVDYRSGNLSKSAAPSEHATLTSNSFSLITIEVSSSGRNDLFNVRFDYALRPYTFQLQLTTGIKTPKMLAEELQALLYDQIITNAPDLFADALTWEYFTYTMNTTTSLGTITLNSPSYGLNSTIEIVDNGTSDTVTDPNYNLYLFLGFKKKIYRPLHETALVFDSDNLFNYEQNTINFKFREDRYYKQYDVTATSLNLVVNHTIVNGPTIAIMLYGENTDFVEKLFEEYDLQVIAYDSSNAPVDYMVFKSISSDSNNPGTPGSGIEFLPYVYTPGDLFKDTASNGFTYSASQIQITCKDNALTNYYAQSYPTIIRIDLVRLLEVSPGVYIDDPAWTPIEFYENNNNYTQNNAIITGKTCTLTLTAAQNSLITNGTNYIVKFWHLNDTTYELVETAKFLNVFIGAITPMTALPLIQLVVDQAFLTNQYDNPNKTITFKFSDGTLDSSVVYYDQAYANFSYIRCKFYKKTYDTIKLNYAPNVYYVSGEAQGIMDLVKAKPNRLIGLEHILKSTTFKPFPLSVQLIVKKNYSVSNAIDAVTSLLKSSWQYDSQNSEIDIGIRPTTELVKNIIQGLASQYGITTINVLSTDPLLVEYTAYTYYFLLEYSIYEQLKQLEYQYATQLTGLTDLYTFSVTAISEGAM